MSSNYGPDGPPLGGLRPETSPKEKSLTNPVMGLIRMDPRIEDQEYDIDIVAVHGLGENWEDTWKDTNGKVWLRDFLPAEFPNARVFSYGYDAGDVFGAGTTIDVTFEATMLLNDLEFDRQGAAKNRPIIFISHSLGGIIVKKVCA